MSTVTITEDPLHECTAERDAALRMVEEAISAADPHPDAVHKALRDRLAEVVEEPFDGLRASRQAVASQIGG